MPRPKFRFDDYLASFPHEEVTSLGAPGIGLGERLVPAKLTDVELDEILDHWNFGLRGKNGMWATAHRSRLQMLVKDCLDQELLEVEVAVRPFNPPQFKAPQRIEIVANGLARHVVEWEAGSDSSATLKLRIPHHGGERGILDLVFIARNSRSPKSFGFSEIEDPLAFCLQAIAVRPAAHVVAKTTAVGSGSSAATASQKKAKAA